MIAIKRVLKRTTFRGSTRETVHAISVLDASKTACGAKIGKSIDGWQLAADDAVITCQQNACKAARSGKLT